MRGSAEKKNDPRNAKHERHFHMVYYSFSGVQTRSVYMQHAIHDRAPMVAVTEADDTIR